MRTSTRYIVGILLGVSALAASPLAGQSSRMTARRNPAGFGLMTVAPDQNVRLLVVNTALPQPDLPPNPCKAIVGFLDGNGNRVGESSSAELLPGESLSVDAFEAPGRGLTRLRPVVLIDQDLSSHLLGPALPPNPCVSTVEMFDVASGRTTVFLDGAGRAQEINAVTVIDGR